MRGERDRRVEVRSAFGEGMAASLGEEKLQCRHGSVCQREREGFWKMGFCCGRRRPRCETGSVLLL